MSLQRVSVSVPVVDGSIDPETVVPLFHDWIRRDAVDGVLIDVARYGHVPGGPGVMLVGHEGDYALDLAGGIPSLRYTLKRDNDGTPRELVARSLRRLGRAVAEAADAGVAVDEGRITVQVYDRLRAPNTPETAATLSAEIEAGVRDVLGDVRLAGEAVSDDPRDAFGLRLRTSPAD